MASGNLGGGSPASERVCLTTSSPSRLSYKRRLHRWRGALFLINFLSKLLILGSPTEGRSTASPFGELSLIALLRSLFLPTSGAKLSQELHLCARVYNRSETLAGFVTERGTFC